MTSNNRLKDIRIHFRKTQKEFGESFGLKQGSYADVERGKVQVSSTIKMILEKEYKVNLKWLESGEGNAFLAEHQPEQTTSNNESLIPMYNFSASAGEIETYMNPNDIKIVGYLNVPGSKKDNFALSAYGHSMYPTIANGDWAVLRPIQDIQEIVWGEIYYIEWADYKMFKRLLFSDDQKKVILWSDNQEEKIGTIPKFSPIIIDKEKIRKLCLVTEILKKPNY